MFDIGFLELTLIGAIALLVFGPERLPELARTLGRWVGRLRRMVTSVRNDIERELQMEELEELRKLRQELDPRRASRWLAESRDEFERGFNQTVVSENDLRGDAGSGAAGNATTSPGTEPAAETPEDTAGTGGETAPAGRAPPTRSIWDEPGEPVDADDSADTAAAPGTAGITATADSVARAGADDAPAESSAAPPADAPADEPADADERR